MEARNLLERDLLDHVEALLCAFDEAWASIAPAIDLASVENARLNLADAIIAHVSTLRTDDLATLKAAALASFRKRQSSRPSWSGRLSS
jgi:hypothetical protein